MIKKISSSIKLMLRVLKNLFIRPFRIVYNKIMYFFNAGKLVNAIPGVAKKLPKILKTKPEKREDYFDWGSFYIAKSLVFLIIILLIVIPLLIIFLIAPAFISWWGVKKFYTEDSDITSYNGRVLVYFDQDYENLKFEGRLSDGQATEKGTLYYENGRLNYYGSFTDGNYSGEGILYYDDGSVNYSGEFEKGVYNGMGELTSEDGKVYSGYFEKGMLQGRGTITVDDKLYYDGNFTDGEISGAGRIMYTNGVVKYNGTFSAGLPNGSCIEYFEDGSMKYSGEFLSGEYNGSGTLYGGGNVKLYTGSFEMGKYNGTGTQYDAAGSKLYTGEFEGGVYSGNGTLYCADGSVVTGTFAAGEITGAAVKTFADGMKYEGCFEDNLMSGSGIISDVVGSFTYAGNFLDNDIDYGAVIGGDVAQAKVLFSDKLTQRTGADCFYLESADARLTLKCSYAQGDNSAAVTEMCSKPLTDAVIKSADDISAPGAASISEVTAAVPDWIYAGYGISAAKCYAAAYSNVTVFFWTDSAGALLLKSAAANTSGIITEVTPDETQDNYGLTSEEITAIFDELGLNREDFSSLGL